ncbi:hypothetical protein DFH08DRAFT_930349 [Mycena albidolilacea]|uniref:Transmembrane protein n=1 Tax=Mycena albidolilacea TaxID=1033008 RepID=A0AAD7APG0_9AGAR|nr:hypothetical protein DFH08DRAFT_930349 [Mycena albidolilacea]
MSAAPTPDLCTLSMFLSLDAVLSDPALSGAFNPDVLGYGVRISSFAMNVFAAILIRWGDAKDSEAALRTLLIQIGSIVLCTMLSVVRGQLTFFDGLFTLTVVHSPIAWYIIWINGREIYGWAREAPRRISVNAVLCFAVVFGWLSLNLVVWFKGRRFPGENCGSIGFADYLLNVVLPATPIYSLQTSIYFWAPGLGYITDFVVFGWVLYMLHFQSVGKRHTWLVFVYVFMSYFYWSFDMVVGLVEPGFNLSYGQLAWDFRKCDKAQIHRALAAEVIFFWCGNGKLARWINRRYFNNKLVLLSPMEPSLPTTQPLTPPILVSNPTITVASTTATSSAHSSVDMGDEASSFQLEDLSPQSQSSLQASTSAAGQGHTQCSSVDVADGYVFDGDSITHSITGPIMLPKVLSLAHTAEEVHNSSIPQSESPIEMLTFEQLGAALSSVNEEQEPTAGAGSPMVDQFNDVHNLNSSNIVTSWQKDYRNGEIRNRTNSRTFESS